MAAPLLGCADSGPSEGSAAALLRSAAAEPVGASAGERVVDRLGLHGVALEHPIEKPDFVLTDTRGEPFAFRSETDGYLTLLFFGYTSCPDICPVHLANLAAVLRRAPPEVRSGVKVVFVGVDPERDTPEQMREWLDAFDRDFVGLTGTPEELAAAQSSAAVPAAVVDREWQGGYSVSHAGWISLFTQDNLGRLRYPFGVRQREWAHDLDVLVREGWPGVEVEG